VTSGLRRFARSAATRREVAAERCELCGQPCGPEGTVARPGHPHVADVEERTIRCACRPCWLLFTRRGRLVAVPERFAHVPRPRLTPAQWDAVQIPVRIAFLFRSGETREWSAFYPSPAGATQSLLALDAWAEVVAANPVFDQAEPDVEAVLVQRTEAGSEVAFEAAFEAYVVPITACYELVARVRMTWTGFDGGDAARAEITGFFAALRERAAIG